MDSLLWQRGLRNSQKKKMLRLLHVVIIIISINSNNSYNNIIAIARRRRGRKEGRRKQKCIFCMRHSAKPLHSLSPVILYDKLMGGEIFTSVVNGS